MSSRTAPDIIELDNAQLEALVLRLEAGELAVEDIQTLVAALKSYAYVTQLIDQKSTTIARLRKLLFGAETEKTAAVTGHVAESPSPVSPEASGGPSSGSTEARQKSKGHGRNGAEDFPGAKRVSVPHEALSAGDPCPSCARGTLYGQPQSGIVLRFTGQPPVQVTIYELEKLRCGLCGEVFTAKPPEAAGLEKYDPTVASMVALLKYGNGLPFNRLDGLQENLGMPLPSSTQWEIVAEASSLIQPAYDELIRGSSAESVGEFGVFELCSAECQELQDSPAGILRGGRAAGISQRGSPDLGLLCMGVNAAARGEVDVGTGGGCCWCSTGFPAAEQHREHRAALSGRDAVVKTAPQPEPPQDACEEYSQSSRAAQVFRLPAGRDPGS